MTINQKGLLTRPARVLLMITSKSSKTECPENSWEELKFELNARFSEVNDTYHTFTMLHKAKQVRIKFWC